VLDTFPDPDSFSYDELVAWIDAGITRLRRTSFSPDVLKSCQPYVFSEDSAHVCGAEASPAWRRFFLATLFADWACYEALVDRADYARLKYIMTSAARYFRVWMCTLPDGQILPVGYTGWYPIARFVYDGLQRDPSQIDDRGIFMPLRYVAPEDIRYAYAFNISIIKELKNTSCSRQMIRSYQKDARSLGKAGIAAITVGADGAKLSSMTDFKKSGTVTVQGESETLFLKDR